MPPRISPLGIAVLYAAFAGLWIVGSDALLEWMTQDPALHLELAMFKGLAFVLVTTVLLYVVMKIRQAPDTEQTADIPDTLTPDLRQTLPLIAAMALCAPLVGILVYAVHARHEERATFDNLNAIAQIKGAQIESWLAERRYDGNVLASSRGFAERVEIMLRTGNPREAEFIRDRLVTILAHSQYESAVLLDGKGNITLSAGVLRDYLPASTRALIPETQVSRETRLGEMQRGASGHISMDIIVPLVSAIDRQTPIGTVVFSINPATHLYPLIQSWPSSSPSGETLLVQREGDTAVYLNELRHKPGTALALRHTLSEITLPAAKAIREGTSGNLRGSDYRGVEVLAVHKPVAETPWHIVAKVDRNEILLPARQMGWWTAGITFFAVVLIALALLLFLRQRRHAEALRSDIAAQRIMAHFFTLPFIGMAITSPATKHWVRYNDRLCEILGYARDELGQKSWAEMTHPDDLDKDVEEFQRVLDGKSEGYAMDKRFIRKDGVVAYASIDVKCLRKADGTVDYFVATVQDIIECKQNELTIQSLSRSYATLSRCNAAILYSRTTEDLFLAVCEAAVEAGGIKMAWIGTLDAAASLIRPVASAGVGTEYLDELHISTAPDDPAGRGPTGTAARENQPVWCQDFVNDPRTAPWHERGAAMGWGSSAALPLRRGGTVAAVLTLYSGEANTFSENTRALLAELARNISFALDTYAREAKRLHTEQKLKDSEERYRLLVERSQDGILLSAADGRILTANPAACRMLGRTEAELLGAGHNGIVDVRDPRLPAALAERERTGTFSGELTLVRGNGEKFPAELSTTLFNDSEGSTRSSMIVRDISDRKKVETRITAQIDELQRWSKAVVGREERILALKHEINTLLAQAGQPPRYPSAVQDADKEQKT